jgi:EmrB/QacA subfamily drug resistance transporter
LGFSPQNLQWIVSAYSLAFGGFLLLSGKAADLFGRRRVLTIGLGLFTIASLIGGLAQSQAILIAARAVQGLGAAIVSPTALSMLTTTFAEGKMRNRALSVWGAIAAGGFAVGVLLGGILTDALSWRWVMFVNVPIGLLTIFLTPILLPEIPAQSTRQKIDLLGAVTVTSGLVTLVYGLEQASGSGWGSPQTLILLAISLVLLAAFVWIEAHAQDPLVPLRVFRLRTLIGANSIGLLISAASGSIVFSLTLYMQQVLNYSALQTGLAFLPQAIAAMVAAPIASHLAARFGIKMTLTGSMTLTAVGLLHLSRMPVQGIFVRDLLPGSVIIGFGMVMTLVAVTITSGRLRQRGNIWHPGSRAGAGIWVAQHLTADWGGVGTCACEYRLNKSDGSPTLSVGGSSGCWANCLDRRIWSCGDRLCWLRDRRTAGCFICGAGNGLPRSKSSNCRVKSCPTPSQRQHPRCHSSSFSTDE